MLGWKLLAVLSVVVFAGLTFWIGDAVSRNGGSDDEAEPGGLAATRIVTPATTLVPTPVPTPVPDPALVGAGDIASCTQDNDVLTAELIDAVVSSTAGEVVVFTAGDNVYEDGTLEEYEQCYDPTWGRHKARTRPAPGNHDYGTGNADGYFAYFGAGAGDPALGYYSYDLGAWHIIVLNTSDHCRLIPCSQGSPQEAWLRSDLAAHPSLCTLAIWHDPLFSSGSVHGNSDHVKHFWEALYQFGADLVVNGHEHNYERFAPQTPDGALDLDYGLRQFIVGTGGESHYQEGPFLDNSEAASGNTYGVMKLTLHAAGYDWEFISEERGTFRDSGGGTCHGPPANP